MVGRIPPAQSMGKTAQRLADTEGDVDEALRFDSSQYGRLYAKMLALYNSINDQVSAAISLLSYTKAEILDRIAAPPSSVSITGSLTASTSLTVGTDATIGGNAAVSGTVTAIGDIATQGDVSGQGIGTFLASRNLVLSTSYAGMWMDVDGRLGLSPSSIRYKTDIEEWRPSDEAMRRLMMVRTVWYRLDPDVVDGADPDAPRVLGIIAEELEALGFPEFVFYDGGVAAQDAIEAQDGREAVPAEIDPETGEELSPEIPAVPPVEAVPAVQAVAPRIQGVNYDRITIALLRLAQWEHARHEQETAALRTELDEIRTHIGITRTEE